MSKVDFNITAEVRSDLGKGASRRLRHEGKVPAVIYGGDKDPVSLTLDHDSMFHHLENEAFYSHILTIDVAGTKEKAVLKDLQRHPAKPIIMHADFMRVSEKEKLKMHVPLHFINEATAPGVKAGGQISHTMTDVEVICAAQDLPEYIEVDMGSMNVGDIVHLTDLRLPEGVALVALSHGDPAEHDAAVVSIHAPRGGVEVEAGGEEGPTA